jgi:hypothetical protein
MLLDQLRRKRDAALARYQLWKQVVATVEADPEFTGRVVPSHVNGAGKTGRRKGMSKAERAKVSARMKAYWKRRRAEKAAPKK